MNLNPSLKRNLTLRPLAIATAAVISTSAYSMPTVRIIGGAESTPDTYPWMVSLQSKDGQHFCGASLISNQWILTAAHCVNEDKADDLQVVISEFDLTTKSQQEVTRTISQISYHKDYGDDNDIAILKLSSPVEKIPVALATPELMSSFKTGDTLRVMGWGNRSTTGEDFPNILHEVQVPLADHNTCKTNYQSENIDITDNMICAGLADGGKDSCQGDSGGPLVFQKDNQWFQAGVVSFGVGCAQANFFGVYTNVASYLTWIEATKNGPSTDPGNPTDPVEPNDPIEPGAPDEFDDGFDGELDDELNDLDDLDEYSDGPFGIPQFMDFLSFDGEAVTDELYIINDTGTVISIENVHLSNPSFNIEENTCNTTLDPESECKLNVTYTARDEGTEFGYLTVTINNEDYKTALIGFTLDLITDENDYDDMDWYQESEQPWSDIENDLGFELDCSGIAENDDSTIATDVEGPGTLEFDFELEGDAEGNSLSYSVDGVVIKSITSNSRSTNHLTTQISKGKHRISWTYEKKTGNSTGAKASVRNVTFSRSTEPSADASSNSNSGGGSGGSQTPLFLLSLASLLGIKRGLKKLKMQRNK
ncbi:hypothetical protein A9Q81_25315 [Gammaproteobacteria bacterium 42_54_T18]|nr:hypothetical protein A9Q81_25315 [Gammaproteobacteria bacterium 42_54_T18]